MEKLLPDRPDPRPQRSPGGTYGGGYAPAPVLAGAGSLRRVFRAIRAEARRLAPASASPEVNNGLALEPG